MSQVRDLFHKVGNLHNLITVGSGVAKVELKKKYGSRIPAQIKKTISRLSALERHAVAASKDLIALKNIIYGIIDPDTAKPKK